MHGQRPMVVVVDMLCCLLIVFLLLAAPPAKPPNPPTYGQYAVTIQWRSGSNNDVDLYVRDPVGNVCFFAAENIGLMQLEGDDLGTKTSGTTTLSDGRKIVVPRNSERTVIRGIIAGEYTVNVHMYLRNDKLPPDTIVLVQLWTLRGNDHVIHQQYITLHGTGDEQTAFRFRMNEVGNVTSYNRLPAHFTGYSSIPTVFSGSPG